MKMLVFYRSREYTNSIISSTKAQLEKKGMDLYVDFVNLDKKSYIKLFNQLEVLPECVYIWHDEEIVSDYIKENYPSIKVIPFNKDNYVEKEITYRGYVSKQYMLADMIISNFKDTLKKEEVYVVDIQSHYAITTEHLNNIEIADKKTSRRYQIFEDKIDANKYIAKSLEESISKIKSDIAMYENTLKNKKQSLINTTKLYNRHLKTMDNKLNQTKENGENENER